MQPGSVGRPRLGPQRLAWALAWVQLGMLTLKFHQLVVPKLVPWSRLHPNAFVLFCCHLWQSKRGSRPRLVLLFQSDATSGTDRLERSVEVSIHKFFSLEQYILKVINQIGLVLEPKEKKKKSFFTLKWNPSYMENMLTKYGLLDGNGHKSRPYCVWAKSKLYKPNLVLIFLFFRSMNLFFFFFSFLRNFGVWT